jgi:hypothetical protein
MQSGLVRSISARKAKPKIESTDPRVSGGGGRRRRLRVAVGQQPGRRLTLPLSCPNETARFEASTRLDTGTRPHRWAYFGARTRERNAVEERPPDAHHGCDHRGARCGPAYPLQRHRIRGRRHALGPEHGRRALRGCRLYAGSACSGRCACSRRTCSRCCACCGRAGSRCASAAGRPSPGPGCTAASGPGCACAPGSGRCAPTGCASASRPACR